MIERYQVAICQAERVAFRAGGPAKYKENKEGNLKRYCDLIDEACTGVFAGKSGFSGFGGGRVKLITFGEFALTGHHLAAKAGDQLFNKSEIIEHLAVKIPGEETDVLAEKSRQHGVYIAAVNFEVDPEWPDFYFNTGFIISPEGKIILKYRKTLTNNPMEVSCTAHDIMKAYKNPITKKYDPFPVIDTSIGRLAIMICADLGSTEIPRVYALKGAEVLLYLTSGNSHSAGGPRHPLGVLEAVMQANAFQNSIYFVNSNWGPELGARYPRARIAGSSKVYDFIGNLLAKAEYADEMLVRANIDIEALRQYRQQYYVNRLALIRSELYAPYYSKTIYPPNTFLDDGPIEQVLDENQLKFFKQAGENLQQCQDFYRETDI
ncbi:nitrilase-related carbon-nitrogen hydrolase [Chloroflexota bacterium]